MFLSNLPEIVYERYYNVQACITVLLSTKNLVNYWLVSGDFYEKAEILRNLESPLLLIYKLFFPNALFL